MYRGKEMKYMVGLFCLLAAGFLLCAGFYGYQRVMIQMDLQTKLPSCNTLEPENEEEKKLKEQMDALLEQDDYPRVVADSALSTYLRQYSGKIQSPYARSVSFGSPGELGRRIYGDLVEGNYASLAQTMANYDYEFLATENAEGKKKNDLKTAGFELLCQVREYGIYRVHCKKTEL